MRCVVQLLFAFFILFLPCTGRRFHFITAVSYNYFFHQIDCVIDDICECKHLAKTGTCKQMNMSKQTFFVDAADSVAQLLRDDRHRLTFQL